MPGAAEALDTVRRAGLRCGVLTNQSGIARGRLQRPGRRGELAEVGRWFLGDMEHRREVQQFKFGE